MLGEEFKQLGNECFHNEELDRAEAYYGSAILQG